MLPVVAVVGITRTPQRGKTIPLQAGLLGDLRRPWTTAAPGMPVDRRTVLAVTCLLLTFFYVIMYRCRALTNAHSLFVSCPDVIKDLVPTSTAVALRIYASSLHTHATS